MIQVCLVRLGFLIVNCNGDVPRRCPLIEIKHQGFKLHPVLFYFAQRDQGLRDWSSLLSEDFMDDVKQNSFFVRLTALASLLST